MRSPTALVALFASGCYTLTPYETIEKIPIRSAPPGALITMTDETGSKAIGNAPLDADVTVVHDRYDFNAASSWVITGLSLVLLGLSIGFAIKPPDETVEATGTVRPNQLVRIMAITGAVTFGITSLFAVPVTIVGHLHDGEDLSLHYKTGVPSFQAKLAGYTDATTRPDPAVIPPPEPLALELRPGEGSAVIGRVEAVDTSNRPVLAIFDLDPGNSGVSPDIAAQLSEYLTAKLAGGGRYRVVPRSELRDRLGVEKRTSYKDCFDEACQIELGKAVAAEKTLAPKLIRVGATCALTATVFDLKSEAADAAQTIRTACEQEGLMDAIDSVADRLSER